MLHAYPPVKPNQVHLRCVPVASYRFLQTLPLASNALAIRIIFPSVGVIQASFSLTGLPASLGKQQMADSEAVGHDQTQDGLSGLSPEGPEP